ncbi:MAG: diacylglycerol kinase family protein [Deltaproteobacteria bacterium]|nr:diacylglycerol kinase family protein [Deltaproteobacteria bacterium]
MTSKKWLVIYNPTAGHFRAATLSAIMRGLEAEGIEPEARPTTHAGHAREIAAEIPPGPVVAVYGGDGSLNEAANGLAGRGIPLAFLPGGTANVMADELGLPHNPVKAARLLARGRVRDIRPGGGRMGDGLDGAAEGERLFLLMAGFGMDAQAVYRVSPRGKKWFGKGAYVYSGLKSLLGRQTPLMVETGLRPDISETSLPPGETPETPETTGPHHPPAGWVVAARSAHYGGPFRIHPRAGLLAPRLGLVAVSHGRQLLFLARNLVLGWHRSGKGVRLEDQETLRVTSPNGTPAAVQVDGEYLAHGTVFTVGLSSRTLPFLFPPEKT